MADRRRVAAHRLSLIARPRLVLDTDAWLDLLVFGDAALDALRDAIARQTVEIVVDPPAFDELLRVLAYPALALDPSRREDVADHVRRLAMMLGTSSPLALPRCRDPDDQKFLALAANSGAAWLLTRDDALLELAARFERDTRCRICTPAEWSPVRPGESGSTAGTMCG